MRKLLWFVFGLLLVFTVPVAHAAAPKPVAKHKQAVLRTDTTALTLHNFNDAALQRYAKQKEFKYEDAPVETLSLWDRFWHWVWTVLGNIFYILTKGKATWLIFKTGLFVVAGFAVVYIILKVAGIDIIKLFRGESANIQIPYDESLENIHVINFDGEIENAINTRNYRLAVRLLYLRCLKQLSDAQLIHWQIEKTNTSYLNELTDPQYRQQFSLLTTQFEYVWYGDFPVDGQAFQNINTLFIELKKVLP